MTCPATVYGQHTVDRADPSFCVACRRTVTQSEPAEPGYRAFAEMMRRYRRDHYNDDEPTGP